MKRLLIATTLLVTATGVSAWAQTPATNDSHHSPQTAAPTAATNCGGSHDNMAAKSEKPGCAMAPENMKSGHGAMPMQQMMQDMTHGQPQPGGTKSDQTQGGKPQ